MRQAQLLAHRHTEQRDAGEASSPRPEISFQVASNGARHDETTRPRVRIYGTLDGTEDIGNNLPLVEEDGFIQIA